MFIITTTYDDGFSKTEHVNDVSNAFASAAIYTIDEECVSVVCRNTATNEIIINFHR